MPVSITTTSATTTDVSGSDDCATALTTTEALLIDLNATASPLIDINTTEASE